MILTYLHVSDKWSIFHGTCIAISRGKKRFATWEFIVADQRPVNRNVVVEGGILYEQ